VLILLFLSQRETRRVRHIKLGVLSIYRELHKKVGRKHRGGDGCEKDSLEVVLIHARGDLCLREVEKKGI